MAGRRLLVRTLLLVLASLVPALAAQADALPGWLPGTTKVGVAGPQSGPMDIFASTLAANSGNVSVVGNTVTFENGMMTQSTWQWTWTSITLDRDPGIGFVGGFKNVTSSPMDFIFSTSTPISPALATTLYGGSTIVTYADSNFDNSGGLLDDGTNAAYTGTIDGNEILDLLATLSLTPDFAGDASKSATETQGLPGPSISGPAANSTIGILHRFNLSGNDQATFNSTFQVVIPEPGTAALLAVGLVALAATRRRRAR